VEDAAVDISVIATHFFKGTYIDTVNGDPRFQVDYEDRCVSEDVNNNGIEDPGEDTNSNGRLDPVPSATVPGSVSTGPDGTADFTLTYPKSECSWVAVDLIATTRVGGTESRVSQNFTLACTAPDLDEAPPGGNTSPYGALAGSNTDD
jgi:hypothetical protein